jgi:quercetin dioxygenase-like cupin family protein
MNRKRAVATLQVDNDRTVVTEWRFEPGAESGWHLHAHDYVVVPVTDGELLIETAGGVQHSRLSAGQSHAGESGVEHNVVNAGEQPLVFVEIEIL